MAPTHDSRASRTLFDIGYVHPKTLQERGTSETTPKKFAKSVRERGTEKSGETP
jgi:hypothetical protein